MLDTTAYFLGGVALAAVLTALFSSREGRAGLIAILATIVGDLIANYVTRVDVAHAIHYLGSVTVSPLMDHPISAVGGFSGGLFVAICKYRKTIATKVPARYLVTSIAVLFLLITGAVALIGIGTIR